MADDKILKNSLENGPEIGPFEAGQVEEKGDKGQEITEAMRGVEAGIEGVETGDVSEEAGKGPGEQGSAVTSSGAKSSATIVEKKELSVKQMQEQIIAKIEQNIAVKEKKLRIIKHKATPATINELVKEIRKLKDILKLIKESALQAVEYIRDMWMKYVKGKQS